MSILTYRDLITHQKDQVEYLKKRRDAMRATGITVFYGVNKSIDAAERILKLLKTYQKEAGQADLFDLNVIENHKA